MQSWAAEELRYADLGDQRLNRRLVRVVEDLARQPSASVPQASGTWAATKAVYRFWDSERVAPEAMRASHTRSTVERVRGHEWVLAVQDTTNLDFAHHPQTKGLGPLDNAFQWGLKVHSTLAVSSEGVPLGLLCQEVWARDPASKGSGHRRRKREIHEKESQRWLTALEASQQTVPAEVQVVTVADREADIYALFALPRRRGAHLLIRGTHERRTGEVGYLWETMRQSPVCGRYTFEAATILARGQELMVFLPQETIETLRQASWRSLSPGEEEDVAEAIETAIAGGDWVALGDDEEEDEDEDSPLGTPLHIR